jgi:hypothetical protein
MRVRWYGHEIICGQTRTKSQAGEQI